MLASTAWQRQLAHSSAIWGHPFSVRVCSTCSREGRDESGYTEFASAGMNDLLLPQRTEGDSKV